MPSSRSATTTNWPDSPGQSDCPSSSSSHSDITGRPTSVSILSPRGFRITLQPRHIVIAADYRICARLLSRRLARAQDLAAAVRERRSELVTEPDLELIAARVDALFAAAAEDENAALPEILLS
ncbi:MAG: hypothetical protein GY856_32160 [bacterium]|nr:hypothetical protein [bacterium]